MSLLAPPVVRFVLVGLTNAALSYSVFHAGLHLLPPLLGRAAAAQALAYAAGIVWSFVLNRSWTFRSRGAIGPAFAAFAAAQLLYLATSAALLGLAIDVLALAAAPSWLAVMGVITFVNYTTLRRLVFPPAGHSGPPAEQELGAEVTATSRPASGGGRTGYESPPGFS